MPMSLEDLDQLMAARYSCRGFKSDAVPRDVIDNILRTAQRDHDVGRHGDDIESTSITSHYTWVMDVFSHFQ